MNGRNNKITVKKANPHRFFFIKPRTKSNIRKIVERLFGLEDISEVLVSEGDYGLIIKACYADGEDRLRGYLSKNFKGRFGEAVCYYAYKR